MRNFLTGIISRNEPHGKICHEAVSCSATFRLEIYRVVGLSIRWSKFRSASTLKTHTEYLFMVYYYHLNYESYWPCTGNGKTPTFNPADGESQRSEFRISKRAWPVRLVHGQYDSCMASTTRNSDGHMESRCSCNSVHGQYDS